MEWNNSFFSKFWGFAYFLHKVFKSDRLRLWEGSKDTNIFLPLDCLSSIQINLKGLDGVQGPVYVGTGCVFRRKALYGVDPPLLDSPQNDDDFLTHFCCGPRKRRKEPGVPGNATRRTNRANSSVPMFNLEDIEEGIEGLYYSSFVKHYVLCTTQCAILLVKCRYESTSRNYKGKEM